MNSGGLTMSNSEGSKIAIIGAGSVGAAIAFTMSIKQTCAELVLIDVNKEKAQGEVIDISHGLPFLGHMNIHAGDYDEVKDADIIIVTAGIPRKEGETRIDLAVKNVKLAHIITDSIMQHYNGGVIMLVSNPCDVVTYKVTEWTGLPAGQIIGSGTNLDSARFRYLLSQKLNVDVRNVHGYVLGEHGETQFPCWSRTHIAGMPVDEYAKLVGVPLTDDVKADIADKTRLSGAEIIKLKRATFNGIAVSATTLAESILNNEHTVRTVCTKLDGQYGKSNIAMNVPCVLGGTGIEKVLELPLNDSEMALFNKSEENIRAAIESVKDL